MTITLAEAREEWFRRTIMEEGGHCPCCDRWGKQYRRGINKTMAYNIGWLAGMGSPGGEWIDVPRRGPRFVVASNQLPTMRWWDLCERNDSTAEEEDKKHSGFWRITELGALWAANRVRVPKYVWTYDGEVKHIEGPNILISEVIENFSFTEIMNTHRLQPRRNDDSPPTS